jgi:hypothetical protein
MKRPVIALVTTAALAAVVLLAWGPGQLRAADPGTIPVEDWASQKEGKTGIPDGWKAQSWGSPKYDFRIESEGGRKVLHMKSAGDNSTISKEVKVDVKTSPILQWSWRMVTLPKGGNACVSATDDEAAQIYVTFPRFPTAVRSRIVSYIWDTTAPVGTFCKSQKTGLVTYVVVRSGTAELNKWMTESRNVLEDFKKIYGEAPGEDVGVISLAINTNNTNSTAESFFGEVFFRKP